MGIALCAIGSDTHPLGGTRQAVVDKDVGRPVRVPGDEVACEAREGDETAIRRDRGTAGAAVALGAVGGEAYAFGRASQVVMDEDVGDAVRIAWHEIGGLALEGDEAPIGRDRGRVVME